MKKRNGILLSLFLFMAVLIYYVVHTPSLCFVAMDYSWPRAEEEWKRPPGSKRRLPNREYIVHNGNLTEEETVKDKFSVIIPTFKRMKLLTEVLKNYCAFATRIDTIIVVWNDMNTEIPFSLKEFPCGSVRIVVKKGKINSLHNRFLPYHELRTEGTLPGAIRA